MGLKNTLYIREKIEIATEVQYSRKGWSTFDANGDKQTFEYLDGIHTITYKPMKNIGFYGGINTAVLFNESKVTADRDFDIGLVAGFSIAMGRYKIFTHYNYGLLNTELNTPGFGNLRGKALNSNLQFGLNYSFYKSNKDNPSNIDNPFKAIEVGFSSQDLSKYRALLKKQIGENKYIRYDLSFSELFLNDLTSDNLEVNFAFQLGFGIEKRKQYGNVEILTGPMYRLGLDYWLDQRFIVSPFFGYIVGAQYIWKSKINIGLDLVPGLTLNYVSNKNSSSYLNTNIVFRNIPNFFITYKIARS